MTKQEFDNLLNYDKAKRFAPYTRVVSKRSAKEMRHNLSKVKGTNKKKFVISIDALPWRF
jgi:hypothetical protein